MNVPNLWLQIIVARGFAIGMRLRIEDVHDCVARNGVNDAAAFIDGWCDTLSDLMLEAGFPRPDCDYPITREDVAAARERSHHDRRAYFDMESHA